MTPISELVNQLGSGDPVNVFRARQALRAAVDRVTDPSESDRRDALATELAAELIATAETPAKPKPTNVPDLIDPELPDPKHSAEVRRLLCWFLAQVASDNQVPALTTAAQDLEIREEVRWALGSLGTQVATSALVKALGQVGPDFRIGVINALAGEHWMDAMAALRAAAGDPDPDVRLAAIEGLASFPEFVVDQQLAEAARLASPDETPRIQKARVRLAETFRLAGQKQAAAAIYQSILTDAPEGSWKVAAPPGPGESEGQDGLTSRRGLGRRLDCLTAEVISLQKTFAAGHTALSFLRP